MCRLAIALSLSLLLPAVQAQETLRERLKARAEQRRADKASDAPAKGGLQELQVQGRKVLVHLPTGYDAANPAPLVLAFHGGGGHAEYMADDEKYGLQRKADEAGFVVAFPNGYSKLPGGRFATWNAGGCCGDARDRKVDDVGFARAVVTAIQARYSIDARRVFATGMSNGGMLSHRLACEAADVFRAVASVAGTDATTDCKPSQPISVLHIHAKDDTHVLFNGGAGADAFRDTSKVMDFVSVPETMSRWVQRNRCAASPQRALDKPGATCETYSGCAGGVSVQLCVTETGGHSWPGADSVRRGKPSASRALDANDAIWRFFEQAAR
jgi:polyhydroxybutyrate depolymerase